MRKKLLFCITLVCFSCALFFSACACNDDSGTESPQTIEPTQTDIILNKSDISLILGDTTYVVANYTTVAGEELIFRSVDEKVARVDESGLVTAENIGETKIIVTYGEKFAECCVKVDAGEYLPSIHLNYVAGETINVSMTDKVNLTSYVSFNGKRFSDGVFTYLFDETIGTVENGFFSPKKEGETLLTVQGSWRGFDGVSLQKTFKVNVILSFEFYVNNGTKSYSVHNRERVGTDYYGPAEMDFIVSCFQNGVEINNFFVEITKGEDVVVFDRETEKLKVVDKKTGEAEIIVKATDGNGEIHTLVVNITVRPSSQPNEGYFNPEWVEEKIDYGYFNIEWIVG